MIEHGLTGRSAATGDDVDDACRKHVIENFTQHEKRKRRRGRRLDHHRVACGQCRSNLPGPHQQREVPWNDLADHADRFTQNHGERIFIDHDGFALVCAQAARKIAEMIRRQRNVDERRFANRLAVILSFNGSQLLGAFVDLVGNLEQKRRTFCRRPRRPCGKRLSSGLNGAINIGRRGVSTDSELFAACRVGRHKGFSVFGVHPLSVNQQAVAILNKLSHCKFPFL